MNDATFENFFALYSELYMASDAAGVSAMYEVPFLAVRDGRPIHLDDAQAVRDHLSGLMEAYRSAGATRATIVELDVRPLGRSSALATVRWNALADDGTLLRDFRTSYHLLRDDPDGWHILTYTYHD